MSAYELARELATNGNDLFISQVLAELYYNWEGTYNAVVDEIKAEIEWNSEA